MTTFNMGGAVNHTSSFSGPWPANPGNFWYTDGYSIPTARVDLNGNTPMYVSDIVAAYTSGPLTDVTIFRHAGGGETSGGTIFPNSGGLIILKFYFTSGGTLYVGRATGNGFLAVRNRDGTSVVGGLVATLVYGEVPSVPLSLLGSTGPGAGQITVSFAAPASHGDLGILNYVIQTGPTSGGPWTTRSSPVAAGSHVITPGAGSFFVRVYAVNAAGSSVAAVTASAVAAGGGGGRRFDGASWGALTAGRRFNGAAWVDLSARRRFDGTNWVDITA